MEITIKFRNDEARRILYFLRWRYNTKAHLPRLCKAAIREAAGREASETLVNPKGEER